MTEYTSIPSRNLITALPLDLRALRTCNVAIAGGAVRDSLLGEQYSDIDIFGTTQSELEKFCDMIAEDGFREVHTSEKLRSFKGDGHHIQVILRNYDTFTDLLDSFDFTICQFYANVRQDELVCNPEGLIHAHRKRLVVNKVTPEYALDTLRRVQKYVKKGYTICNGGLLKIANAIRDVDEETFSNSSEFYLNGDPRIVRFD